MSEEYKRVVYKSNGIKPNTKPQSPKNIMKDVININQTIMVRVTDDGVDILLQLEKDGVSIPNIIDNYIEIQLWKLMALFGEFIALGYEPIDYNIYFRREDLYE